MKKFIVLALAIFALIGLIACGTPATPATPAENGAEPPPATAEPTPDSDDTAPSAEQTEEARTITWMTRRSTGWEFMEELFAEYNALNPHITIELERFPDIVTFTQQLQIRAAANALPNLFDIEVGTLMEELAAAETLVNIDNLFAELSYDRMLPVGLSHSRLPSGGLYVIAWENNIEWVWYNRDMFEQAGIAQAPETFDELIAVAQQLAEAGIVPVAQFPVWHATRWLSMMPFRLTGNDFLNQLVTGEASMSDPVGLQAATWFQDFAAYFQPGWATGNYGSALEAFLGGHAAMYFIGSWEFGSFLDGDGAIRPEYGFFSMPTLQGAVTGPYDTVAHSGLGTAILAETFDSDIRDFILWLLENYPQKAFEAGVMPAMTFDTDAVEMTDFQRLVLEHSDRLEVALRPWDVVMHDSAVLVMNNELENLGLGIITPEEFAERLDAAIADNLP